jgi:sodium transport system permease protein
MPVVGAALLLKAMLLVPVSAGSLYLYAIPVLVTSIGYSLLALWWAIEQFAREDVLFREAEQFEVGLWVRHLLRDKEPTPSFAEAGFCFVTIMLLQFGLMRFMQQALAGAAPAVRDIMMMRLVMAQQLAVVATPALLMGVLLTASVVRTFRLRLPDWRLLAVAAVLPFAVHPLSVELLGSLKWFFPPLPQSAADVVKTMADTTHPWWLVLLTFAVVPAICEETAFRGFILSGFKRGGRVWLAIGLSSLTFGIMHMIPQQVFNATLLGLVLGLIAVRSESLFPCILFHFIYNSLEVFRGWIGEAAWTGPAAEWFIRIEDGGIRYQWPTLSIAAAVAAFTLRWLVNQQRRESQAAAGDVRTAEAGHRPQTHVTG